MGASQSAQHPRPPRPVQPPPPYPPAPVYGPPGAPQAFQPTNPYGQGPYGPPMPPGPYGGPMFYPPGTQPPRYPPPGPGGYPPPYQYPPPPPPQMAGPRPITQEYQTTQTIKNQVNLKKPTLKLKPVAGDPSKVTLSFAFDASAACRVTAFACAHEDVKHGCSISSSQQLPTTSYEKGLDHKYPSSPEAAAGPSWTIDLAQLQRFTSADDAFHVIVRLEALGDEGRAEGRSLSSLEAGKELPGWVQAQTTYARLNKEEDGSTGLRVIKQKLWVRGASYEVQEIYGMEHNRVQGGGVDGGCDEEVEGSECVICLAAPRDTTALPCRHMCMCRECANELKTQTNKCPICRNEIESLLHIKINRGKAPEAPPPGAPSSQPASASAASLAPSATGSGPSTSAAKSPSASHPAAVTAGA